MDFLFKGKPVAVDFDGTCVDHRFPKIGLCAPDSVRVLRRLVSSGAKLILWTMRSDGPEGAYLQEAVNWFKVWGIPLYGVQQNPAQSTWTSSPKAYAAAYIDDAAVGCPLIKPEGFHRECVDWLAVEKWFFPDTTPTDESETNNAIREDARA